MFSTYLSEMTSKYGFNDGELIPAEAEAARTVIVQAGRAWLKKHHPGVTVDPYDRPGCHNYCLIHFHPVDQPEKWLDPPDEFEEFLAEQLDAKFNEVISHVVAVAPAWVRTRVIKQALEAGSAA